MATTTWSIEPNHSELQFKVRHMMISNVTGNFTKFEGTAETEDDDFTTAKVNFTADVNSISTNNDNRDGHLKGDEFFSAETFPTIKFTGNHMEKVSDEEYKLHGELTIRDITKPVTLDVEYGGTAKDSWGMTRAGFDVQGKINRKEFGLTWHAATETGGVVVADEVRLHANVQFVKQEVTQPA
jgi:polyisoprenoid-binding protein YceI